MNSLIHAPNDARQLSRAVLLISPQRDYPRDVDKARGGLVAASVDDEYSGLKLLGRRILLSSRSHAVDDRDADQTDNAYSDPLLRHVHQVGTDRQADNQYDVAYDVNPE